MSERPNIPDRKVINILLAALELEQSQLAELMGYDKGYVCNVFNGHTIARPGFRRAFGETIGSLIFGCYEPVSAEAYPAAPLVAIIERAAAAAPCKREFYRDLGTNQQALRRRESFDAVFVDRVCCALGLHPNNVYPEFGSA